MSDVKYMACHIYLTCDVGTREQNVAVGKIVDPELITINFNAHFCDRIGDVDRGHIEVLSKLLNLRSFIKTDGKVTRTRRLLTTFQRIRKETEDENDLKELLEEMPEYEIFRRKSPGPDSVLYASNLKAF